MAKGGSRVRSGPEKDPNSGRSDRQRAAAKKAAAAAKTAASPGSRSTAPAITNNEFNPLALPASGRKGRVPAFPLPKINRFGVDLVDGKAGRVLSVGLTAAFRKRELQIWGELWKTPQAVAWERDPWRWPTIAKYCRIAASTEAEPDASAALLSRERELRIECGLTPDGLKVNGWAIAPDELAQKRAAKKAPAKKTVSQPRRLRSVSPK